MCEPIQATVERFGENLESSVQNAFEAPALMFSGDFNNLGRTSLDIALLAGAGLLSEEDIDRMTGSQTSKDRIKTDKKNQAEMWTKEAAENARVETITNLDNQVKSLLKGVTDTQRRSPGRAVSLLGGAQSPKSLLGE